MPEEDNPRAVDNSQESGSKDRMDEQKELEEARVRIFDPTEFKFEGNFQYQKVWSETLMNQV